MTGGLTLVRLILLINGSRCSSIPTNPLHGNQKPGSAMRTFQRKKLLILSACILLSIFNSRNACFLPVCIVIQTNPIRKVQWRTLIPPPLDGMQPNFKKWKLKEKQLQAIWKKNFTRYCFAGFLLLEHMERININY